MATIVEGTVIATATDIMIAKNGIKQMMILDPMFESKEDEWTRRYL